MAKKPRKSERAEGFTPDERIAGPTKTTAEPYVPLAEAPPVEADAPDVAASSGVADTPPGPPQPSRSEPTLRWLYIVETRKHSQGAPRWVGDWRDTLRTL